jgi:hypothetical protein
VTRLGPLPGTRVARVPVAGPTFRTTGWTMTRAFMADRRAYNQLLAGLAVLALTVLGSAVWLARILFSWSRKLILLESALAARDPGGGPVRPCADRRARTRSVGRCAEHNGRAARTRATARDHRRAASGRRSPTCRSRSRNPQRNRRNRLKAENALASNDDGRRRSALQSILQQVGRLDALLHDLLTMTQRRQPNLEAADLESRHSPGAIARSVLAPRDRSPAGPHVLVVRRLGRDIIITRPRRIYAEYRYHEKCLWRDRCSCDHFPRALNWRSVRHDARRISQARRRRPRRAHR